MIQFSNVTQHELSQLIGLIKDDGSSIRQALKSNGVTLKAVKENSPSAGEITIEKHLAAFIHVDVTITYALDASGCTVTALDHADKAEPILHQAIDAALAQIRERA